MNRYFSTVHWSPLVTKNIRMKKTDIMCWDILMPGGSFLGCLPYGII